MWPSNGDQQTQHVYDGTVGPFPTETAAPDSCFGVDFLGMAGEGLANIRLSGDFNVAPKGTK